MAANSTIYKVHLQITDLDRHIYDEYALTIACHPSETEERLMMRLLAFARHAHERLEFARGLTEADEPDLWRRDLTGDIDEWIEVGNPEEKTLLRALGRSRAVAVYAYNQAPRQWWAKLGPRLAGQKKLQVWLVAPETAEGLAALARRGMDLQYSVQDGEALFRDDAGQEVAVHLEALQGWV